MAEQRVTKKELQEPDFLQEYFSRIVQYAQENRKVIAIVSFSFLGTILIATGWFLFRMNYENNAHRMYLKTYNHYLQVRSAVRETEAIKGYQELLKTYPSSRAAQIALYRLGNLYFQSKLYDEAMQAYRNFIDKSSSDGELIVLAWSGLGYCQEAKKDYAGALASFEKALKMKSGVLFEGILYRDVARSYEQMNDMKNALEFYRKALSVTNDPSMTMILKQKISMLS